MTTEQFKLSLRTVSIKELTDKIEYYSGVEPRGVNYQTMLYLYNAEVERRINRWEIAEV
jgi:hypothetical protein